MTAPRTAHITITITKRAGNTQPHLVRVRARQAWPGDKPDRSHSFRVKAQAEAYKRRLEAALAAGEPIDPATLEPYSWASPVTSTTWFEHLVACHTHFKSGWEAGARKRAAEAYSFLACVFGGTPEPDSGINPDGVRHGVYLAIKHGTVEYQPQPGDELRHYRRKNETVATVEEVTEALKWLRANSWQVADIDQVKTELALVPLGLRLDGKPYSSGLRKQRRNAMNKVLKRAVFLGLLAENPLKKVETPTKKRERKSTIKQVVKEQVLEPEEVLYALAVASQMGGLTERCVPVWALSGLAGGRPGEGLALRWSQIFLPDPDAVERDAKGNVIGRAFGTIVLTGTRTAHGEWADENDEAPYDGPLKHKDEEAQRTIEIPPELCDILRTHKAKFAIDGNDFVAVTEAGEVLTHSQYQQCWKKVRAKAFGKEHATLVSYDLRHSFISAQLREAFPPALLAEMVGNSVPVLLETYARVMTKDSVYARAAMRRAYAAAA